MIPPKFWFSRKPFTVFTLVVTGLVAGCASESISSPETTPPEATPTNIPVNPTSTTDGAVEVPVEPTTIPNPTPSVTAAPVTENVVNLAEITVELVDFIAADVPIAMIPHPDGESYIVGSQSGTVFQYDMTEDRIFQRNDGALIDLSNQIATGSEQGLLGLTFDRAGEHLYLVYSQTDGDNRLVEYSANGTNERELLIVEQPFANHNGGHLAFGPDGFLYYGLGDGGDRGDPNQTGQNPDDLLGSILRIDPAASIDGPYAIPADNPFVSGGGAAEVWMYGLRNPWRFSFDSGTGDLWIADVGQDSREEINWLSADSGSGRGTNLGWASLEGTAPFLGGNPANHIPPVFEYGRDEGQSVIGGFVSRGGPAELEGVYIYGDWGTGTIWGLLLDSDGAVLVNTALASVPERQLLSFAQGHNGELFVLLADGAIQRIDVVN